MVGDWNCRNSAGVRPRVHSVGGRVVALVHSLRATLPLTTHHNPRSVDAYLKSFDAVLTLQLYRGHPI